MAKGIRLVTRGDDAGSCRSADLAIRDSVDAGTLKNVSVMVPGPTFTHAAELLRDLPRVAIGLHVVVNAEWDTVKWGPVLPRERVPSIVDENGHFYSTPNRLHEAGANVEQIAQEIEAQLDRAREHGLDVAYMDEHMGVGWLPGLRDLLKDLARREGLLYAEGFNYLADVANGSADLTTRLLQRLDAAAPGTYVTVTHPGRDEEDMRAFIHPGLQPGQIARERDAEWRMWIDPALKRGLEEREVEVIRYIDA